jgi:uncharacterized membrane protein YfcA
MSQLLYIILGLVAGIFGGMFGLGGGLIIIPALVYLFGFTQLQAQGTNLVIMLPPIGLLAALRYYYSGNVKLNIVLFVCLGFLFGGFIGAHLIQALPQPIVKRAFGIIMLIVSLRMILTK